MIFKRLLWIDQTSGWAPFSLNPPATIADFLLAAMKITNKQKIYGVMLTLGITAFLIDRAYFTPPAAKAAAPSADTSNHPDVKPELSPALESTNSESIITGKLKSIPPLDWDHLPDAFTAQWISTPQAAVSHSDFPARHKLTAILASHNGGGAIVNGSLIRVGESLDGFTLISVDRQGAIFASGSTQVTLPMGPP